MRFKNWVAQSDKSFSQIAKDLQIDKSYVTLLVKSKRTPSLSIALKIEKYTDGEVTCSELLGK